MSVRLPLSAEEKILTCVHTHVRHAASRLERINKNNRKHPQRRKPRENYKHRNTISRKDMESDSVNERDAALTPDGPILSASDEENRTGKVKKEKAADLTKLDVGEESTMTLLTEQSDSTESSSVVSSPTNESCGGSGAEDNGERAATVAPADADAIGAVAADSGSGKSSPTGSNGGSMKSKIPKLSSVDSSITPPKRRSLPSPGGSTIATGRLGMAARVAPQAPLERRIRRSTSSSEIAQRLKIGGVPAAASSASAGGAGEPDSSGKAKKMSTVESRRAHALTMRARLAAAAEAKKALQPVPASAATSTKKPLSKRKSAPASEEPFSVRRSSFSSQSSCSSIGSSIASSIASSTTSALSAANSTSTNGTAASRLNRIKSSGSVPSFSNISDRYSTTSSSSTFRASSSGSGTAGSSNAMLKKLWPLSGSMNLSEFSLESSSVEDLKSQHLVAERGVQELLKFSSTSVNVKARQEEAKLLKGGIMQLSQHSGTLMAACEALEQRSQRQDQELQISRMEIQRLLNLLAEEKEPLVFSDDAAEAPSQTDSDPNEESGDGEPPKPRLKMDSPLTKYVNEMMKKATDQIEEKWKARFAEQVAEHEQALAQERERSSASVMSNSRLVTETKHEKEDEMKALREENVKIGMEKKQLEFETDAVRGELDFIKSLLDEQDEARSSSTFWQKTTDLAKANRALTEDVTQLNQTVNKLNESARITKIKMKELKVENFERVGKTKVLEVEKQVLQDKLTAMEAKFEDEKTRREQFQVNVEQLTVENTALYAQMVALQTTHEAKMEELRSRYEKRNFVLAGEMRLLQTQNKLMRNSELVHNGGSSVSYDEDEGEMSDRLKEMTEELLNVRQELSEKVDQIAELEWRIGESEQVRRKLHNTIQELRGNIRVHVRLRPFLRSDGLEASSENPKPSIRADAFSSTIVTNSDKPHAFSFDKIYGQSDSQEFVFNVRGFRIWGSCRGVVWIALMNWDCVYVCANRMCRILFSLHWMDTMCASLHMGKRVPERRIRCVLLLCCQCFVGVEECIEVTSSMHGACDVADAR